MPGGLRARLCHAFLVYPVFGLSGRVRAGQWAGSARGLLLPLFFIQLPPSGLSNSVLSLLTLMPVIPVANPTG